MDCLYAKCTPCITDCVMAELEKLGQKYRVALKIAKVRARALGPRWLPGAPARGCGCLGRAAKPRVQPPRAAVQAGPRRLGRRPAEPPAPHPSSRAGPARGAAALHAQGHVRRRLHLRARAAAQVLHRGHLRQGPAAAHPQGGRAARLLGRLLLRAQERRVLRPVRPGAAHRSAAAPPPRARRRCRACPSCTWPRTSTPSSGCQRRPLAGRPGSARVPSGSEAFVVGVRVFWVCVGGEVGGVG
jgi:hypothetical protein